MLPGIGLAKAAKHQRHCGLTHLHPEQVRFLLQNLQGWPFDLRLVVVYPRNFSLIMTGV